MNKETWTQPELTDIDIAEETQLDPNPGTDTVDPLQGDPTPGS